MISNLILFVTYAEYKCRPYSEMFTYKSLTNKLFVKAYTCIYKVPQLTVHVRAKTKPWGELSVKLRDRIVSRQRSGKGYKTISLALKVPKNIVASIILKWKKFGTTKTLPRAALS
jgi:hypothetical protein